VEVLESIRDGLAADATLVGWCQSEFGAAPTVQVDFDDQAEIEYFPLVALLNISQDQAVTAPRGVWTLNGACFVHNSGRTVAAAGAARTITYPGRIQAEGLREQVLAALYRLRLGKLAHQGEVMSHTFHPRYVSLFTLTLEVVRTVSL
jgi:hypothetical protein